MRLAKPGQPGLLSSSLPVAPFVRLALRRSQQVAPLDALPFWLESAEGEVSGGAPVPGELRLCVKRLSTMPVAELKALARAKELGLEGAHSWRLHVMTGTEVLTAEGADEVWDLVGSSCSEVQLELCLVLDGAELSMFSSHLSCAELWAFRDSDAVLASVTLGPWAKLEVEILAPSPEPLEASPSRSVQSAALPRSPEPLVASPPQSTGHSEKMVSPLSGPKSPSAGSLKSVARSPAKLEVEILPQPSPKAVSEVPSSPFLKPLGSLPPLPVRTEQSPKMVSPLNGSEPALASLELVMNTHLPDLSQLAMPESVEIMVDLGPDEFISMREVARKEINELEKLQEQLLAFGVKKDVPEVREVAEIRAGGKIEPILEVPQQLVRPLDVPDEPEPAAEESLGSEEKPEQTHVTHVVREKLKPPGNGSGAPPPKVVEEVEPASASPASPQPCQLDGRGPLPLDLLPKPSLASSPKPMPAASSADASPPSPTPSAPDPEQLPMVFERLPSPARLTTPAPATPATATRTWATPAPATRTPATPAPATPAPATPEPFTPAVTLWSTHTLPERPRWALSPSWLSERWAPSELKSTASTRATLKPLTWSDRIDVNTKRLARIMRGAPRGESSDSD